MSAGMWQWLAEGDAVTWATAALMLLMSVLSWVVILYKLWFMAVARRSVPQAVAAFWQMLRRFSVGANGKIWLDDPLPWQPAIAPIPLIVINSVLAVALALVVSLRALSPSAHDAGVVGLTAPSPVGAEPADPLTG